MNEVGIAISRWKENIEWVEEITSPIDIFVYNRHSDKSNLGGLNVQRCLDKGMKLKIIDKEDDNGYECSTNAYHIWENYNNLNEYTVFTQDRRDTGHCTDIVQRVNDIEKLKHTKYIPVQTGPALIPPRTEHSQTPIEFEYMADRFGWFDARIDWGWKPYSDDYSKIPWFEFVKNMPGFTFNSETGKYNPPDPQAFGMASAFMVSKSRILKHELEYYKRIQEFCNTYVDPRYGEVGRPDSHLYYYGSSLMESVWKYVF